MLKTNNLSFEYSSGQRFEYPDIHLSSEKNLLVLGNSGSGKTTFLHKINRPGPTDPDWFFVVPTKEKVWLFGPYQKEVAKSLRIWLQQSFNNFKFISFWTKINLSEMIDYLL